MTPNYVQAQVLAAEGEEAIDIAVGIQIMMQTLWVIKEQHLQECIIQTFVGGVVKWDTLQEIALPKTLSRQSFGVMHHTLEAETP